ncbi:type I 3-dehydroquinate dehydratase [Latilactobacillus sakei]|uniref:3-dehydroquinate dehydratase n=1 Tax=Latilactobacillus sakei TaxID=1599 RepID=A0AAE8J3J5_LATSK|nr:type I 3-dehydroquinate dehydratase [Latilactobacillus sakei]ARJ71124.1 type I 3-dehydroquinate dehydratase [Latilactobacillus sakei]AWZ44144.1 type I 3-dehydroquinate dehydratase [Latilactobacillus sakei]MCB4408760.1 type I 3-dehydroquinate dehydratase [Latilactobacillus sakei]MCM1598593.1 type I 3-dehydroquinate dehydratase [Latilactobacillus sakei]MCP8852402.1 type I 3-dehydroquinate dehydratase [Latilactobacillus sakei]
MHLEFTTGQTQTAVSLMPRHLDDCLRELILINQKKDAIDILEWRLDYWQASAQLLTAAEKIAALDLPLILTVRTTNDGGLASAQDYLTYYAPLIKAHIGQAIDLEWSLAAEQRHQLAELAHQQHYQVLLSHHDTVQTPDNDTLRTQLLAMQADPDADLLKLATTAQSPADTTRLLAATQSFTHQFDKPLTTMAMSEFGVASRIFGGQFGSAISFGYLETPSAPGQLPIEQLKGLLTTNQA